ncbi:hypothetical protein GGR52DRAFT_553321 [Hypoxylon sp. FL1284]|nr:hypothetical protein GGR52DRAFT_553321 [Hypoxylon sp. FL1284]
MCIILFYFALLFCRASNFIIGRGSVEREMLVSPLLIQLYLVELSGPHHIQVERGIGRRERYGRCAVQAII